LKTIFKSGFILMVVAIILAGCTGSNKVYQSGANAPVTYQTFYDNLSPYGTWIDYREYGHVWTPNVDGDFRPYDTNGHWVYSDEGWAWASDYSWGWAPFHYGRWLYDDMYGWLWVPDYNWSPAWVTWGYVDDYYCWAPLMPGTDVSQQFGGWRPPLFYWNGCRRDHIYDRNLSPVMERREQVANFASRITVINNFNSTPRRNAYYSKGPEVQEVQKYVQPRIEPATIKDVHDIKEARHNGNDLNVYRPPVQDPKLTVRQHPKLVVQPREFRKADAATSKPFIREEQRPVLQRNDQRANVNKLPVIHQDNGNPGNNNGGGRRRGRNQ
jgi:hypothetical protein